MKKQNRKERKEAFIKAYQEEMRKQGLMDVKEIKTTKKKTVKKEDK